MIPYKSQYYENNLYYERYGNYIVPYGQELFLYITDYVIEGIEPFRYSISNKMRIYDYKNNCFINKRKNQYIDIDLYITSKNKYVTFNLHRIYMLVFCYFDGCKKFDVNHIDGNKLNCTPINLEWTSHKENMAHATMYMNRSKLSESDIIGIIDMYNDNCTIKQISEKYNISTGYISNILHGHKGRDDSYLLKSIKQYHPITRMPKTDKLPYQLLKEISEKYNNGSEYYELADEYNIDRSYLTKSIKSYAKDHPEIKIRKLKIFSDEDVNRICRFIESNRDSDDICRKCAEFLHIECTESIRKAISNIYNHKTYTKISSNYEW